MQKFTLTAEISTKVVGATFCVHPVLANAGYDAIIACTVTLIKLSLITTANCDHRSHQNGYLQAAHAARRLSSVSRAA